MPRRVNLTKSIDWTTVVLYLILVIMGWVNIYAAVYNDEHSSIFDISQRYGKQLLWIGAAFSLAFVILLIDSRLYSYLSFLIYSLMILVLIGVLLFGTVTHGARSWFEIGSFKVQPSEFAKIATAMALARFMSSYGFRINRRRNLWAIAALVGLPILLIVVQGDAGSALVYCAFILVLYRAGLPGYYILIALWLLLVAVLSRFFEPFTLGVITVVCSCLVFFYVWRVVRDVLKVLFLTVVSGALLLGVQWYLDLQFSLELILYMALIPMSVFLVIWGFRTNRPSLYLVLIFMWFSIGASRSVDYVYQHLPQHQQTRINVFLGLETDPGGNEYNLNQSKIAIGSGGFSGKGFLQGTQTKYDFVPEQDTDFIFCTVGEEWGFLGSFIVLGLFLALMLRILFLAERQRSIYSLIYGYCVAAIFFFHFAINIGMTIGLAPVIGIPLPFFSYGGSSLWAFTILLFIFVRLDASRAELL